MKVLLFHPSRLPPRDYGGVERVVLWLAKGLVERGHEVWVAAFPGSVLPKGVKLFEVDPARTGASVLAGKLPAGMDVVHFMAPPGDDPKLAELGCAQLTTVHGNGRPGERFPRNTVFLSADHARRHHAQAFVHNGIDPDEVRFNPSRDGRARYLFLSKTSWSVKNVHGAVRFCAKARVPLTVAGGARPYGLRARAWVSGGRLQWAGPVAGERKARLLSESRALIFPIRWPEPFGLVVVEALMAGTPVLARPLGSLPELVTPQVGALLDGEQDWVDFLARDAVPWAPEACRDWAMRRFHYGTMAEGYEGMYRKVLKGQFLNEADPKSDGWEMHP